MAKIEMISLESIRVDETLQSRESLNWFKVEEYKEAMSFNQEFPPIRLFLDDEGILWLGEGFHRVAAANQAGKERIRAAVEPGGRRSARIASMGANSDHGMPRTNADKRRAVRMALQLDKEEKTDLKDREIARMTKTTHTFVAQERAAFNDPDVAGQLQGNGASSRPYTGKSSSGSSKTLKNPTHHKTPETPPDGTALALLRGTHIADDPDQLAELQALDPDRQFDVACIISNTYKQDKAEITVAEALARSYAHDEDAKDEPQQMSLFGADAAPVSAALQQSYGKPAPAAPAFTFATEADFIKAARSAVTREKKESSDNDEWITPQDLWSALDAEFHFTLDVAATASNAKCLRYIDKFVDALSQSWAQGPGDDGAGWMNHPYTLTDEFMGKAFQTGLSGERTMVCLPKVDTETQWWWKYARYGHVRLLRGRLTFSNASSPARFANAVIIFPKDMAKPGYKPSVSHWDWKGDWNAELPTATSQAIQKSGVLLEDRAFFKLPADSEDADSPLIWTPHKAPGADSKEGRKAG